jgi:NAD(P)-dependent dehydrogenase (short-subunit alcohol dehydrogenase family)
MMFDLSGRVALITGASGGFGAQFAYTLTEHGADVVLTGRRRDVLEQHAAKISAGPTQTFSGRAKVLVADLALDNLAVELIAQAEQCFNAPVDILVNNAGIGQADRALDCSAETWGNVLATDLTVPFLLAQEAARRMIACQLAGACIVNVASIFGLVPTSGMIAYAAAKAALVQMTRALAVELGPKGVRVNALAPGWCMTDMTRDYLQSDRGATIAQDIPLRRFGTPADLDGAILLLVSDAGRYINGATLVVDGGLSVGMRDGRAVPKKQEARSGGD